MTTEEIFATAQKKITQYEKQQILRENRLKNEKYKMEFRRKVLIGEIFLKYFPIVLEFTPGKSSDEDEHIIESLNDFMESLSRCQQCFRLLENELSKSK